MKHKAKPRPSRRRKVIAPRSHTADIIRQQIADDPIYAATLAYDRALGAFLVNERYDDKTITRLGCALFEAEVSVAETVPTSLRGIEASARWINRFIAWHGGPENLDGHAVLTAWPGTILTALARYGGRSDPITAAIENYRIFRERFAGTDEADKAAHRKAEREFNEAEKRLRETAPTTAHGVAKVLDLIAAEGESEKTIEASVVAWLRLIADAARALA